LGIVAREGDGCNFGFNFSLEECLQRLDVLANHCDTIGRRFEDLGKSLYLYVFTGKTKEEAEKRFRVFKDRVPFPASGVLWGTPDMLVEAMGKRIDAGFSQFMMTFNYGNLQDSMAGAQLFADEVLPAL